MTRRFSILLFLSLAYCGLAFAVNVSAPLAREAAAAGARHAAPRLAAAGRDDNDVKLSLREDALAALRRVETDGEAVVSGFPVDLASDGDLELHRFELFTPDPAIQAVGEGGLTRPLPRPDAAFFEGRVAGEPDSRVYLAAFAHSLHGFIQRGDGIVAIAPEGGWLSETSAHTLHRMTPEDFAAESSKFRCREDELPLSPRAASPLPHIADTGQKFEATIAVDTDFELYQLFGSNTVAETNYIANQVAAASAIDWRDLITRLKVGFLQVYTSAADPWTATDSLNALYEVGDYWHANHAGVSRSTVVFLSAKNLGGGIAWLGTICEGDFPANGHWGGGYAVIGNVAADISNFHSPGVGTGADLWDIDAVAHEMGHNFGSPHTHCYSPPIDKCYNQEAGCYSGAVVDPGVEGGTIMSYCQLLGWSRINLIFHTRCITETMRPTILNASIPSQSCIHPLAPGDFLDVVSTSAAAPFIYKIAAWGITGGCGTQLFCPGGNVTRAQMAVFLEAALQTHVPPTGRPQTFVDVPPGSFGYDFIEDFVTRGITAGCDATHYCPNNVVNRAQMAVFLLRAEHGSAYTPPACAGIFADVACPGPFTNWIERLYNEGITGGCSASPLQYCPANPVSRAQMAIFLVATFGL
jgi:hypothetical protein